MSQDCDKVKRDNSHIELTNKRSLEFSSEIFKLEISNIPRNLNKFHMAKNMIEQHLKISGHKKIKIGRSKVYVTFGSSEDRDRAISIINNTEYKGQILEACIADAKEDPYIKKQRFNDGDRSHHVKDEDSSGEVSDESDINKQVCPLYDRDYETQIKIKTRNLRNILTMYKQIKKLSPTLQRDAPQLHEWNESNKTISCRFDGVKPSPRITGYRNKCEFNVDKDGNCGFRLGRYKDGSAKVIHPPRDCPILNSKMFEILEKFETHIKNTDETGLTGFDPVTHTGHVRQLTVRTNELQECLIVIDMSRGDLSDLDVEKEIDKIIALLTNIPGIKSIYSNITEKAHLNDMDQSLKLIFGEPYLIEHVMIQPDRDLRLRIGPQSFLQVNTKAAEILYKSIAEIACLNKNSIVLDIGSGIGTIALTLAHSVSHVIGIEIVESAVQDAKSNAHENGIENVEFFCGKAEELLGGTLDYAKRILFDKHNNEGDIVAIVDPPRAGFNTSFVKTLRASNIKKIVYVACDPKSNDNLLSISRPQSKAYQGKPFVPTRAVAIDLFPHTKACELVVVYERLDQVIPSVT